MDFSFSGEILTSAHLNEVYTKLHNARNEWFEIGMALKIDHDTLTAIKTEQDNKQGACLREVLAKRIQSKGPLTWMDLSKCLRSPTVGRNDVANDIDGYLKGWLFFFIAS